MDKVMVRTRSAMAWGKSDLDNTLVWVTKKPVCSMRRNTCVGSVLGSVSSKLCMPSGLTLAAVVKRAPRVFCVH